MSSSILVFAIVLPTCICWLAKGISPLLGKFRYYKLKRIDFCVNFDLKEMGINCTAEQMISLIKRGYIPNHYKEFGIYDRIQHRYVTDKNSFYLKSKSVNVNIYHKYQQLLNKYPGNPSLNDSLNVIRFEVQLKKQKVQYITANICDELLKNHTMMLNLLSNEVAEMMITDYYNRIIKPGDYYSLKKCN
jgi:hypothetical protein